MVYLSRIYTKTGDRGDTGLGDGNQVPKDHPRVSAFGTVDELNALLGIFLVQVRGNSSSAPAPLPQGEKGESLSPQGEWSEIAMVDWVRGIQNDLFDVCADLCLPEKPEAPGQVLRVQTGQAERLEKCIDQLNERLQPLKSFILPGGTDAAAWCHLARTVCRRAERDVVTLAHAETINPQVIIYLNRLSDLLSVSRGSVTATAGMTFSGFRASHRQERDSRYGVSNISAGETPARNV